MKQPRLNYTAMIKICVSIIFIFFIQYYSFSQTSKFDNNNFYLSINGGFSLIQSNDYHLTDWDIEPYGSATYIGYNVKYFPKGKIGYSMNYERIRYTYKLRESQSGYLSNYSQIHASKDLNPLKHNLSFGVNYRITYKRLLIIPYINIGLSFFKSTEHSSIYKENNTNNIRTIDITTDIPKTPGIQFSTGTDIILHFAKSIGIKCSLFSDSYNKDVEIKQTIVDYYDQYQKEEKIKFHNNTLMLSFGLFVSFGKGKKKNNNSHSFTNHLKFF